MTSKCMPARHPWLLLLLLLCVVSRAEAACDVLGFQHHITSTSNERYKLSLLDTTDQANWSTRASDASAAFGAVFASYSDFEKKTDEYRRKVHIEADFKKETAYLETYLDEAGLNGYIACLNGDNGLAMVAVKESADTLLFKVSLKSKTQIGSLRLTILGSDNCSGGNLGKDKTISVGNANTFETYVTCTLKYNVPLFITADSVPTGFSAGFEYVIPKYASCARPEHGIAYDDKGRQMVTVDHWQSSQVQGTWDDNGANKYFQSQLFTKFAGHSEVTITKAVQTWYKDDKGGKSTRAWAYDVTYDPTYASAPDPRCGLDASTSACTPPNVMRPKCGAEGNEPTSQG